MKKKNQPLDLWTVQHKDSKQQYAIGLCPCCGCWNVLRIEADETLTFIGEYETDETMNKAIEDDVISLTLDKSLSDLIERDIKELRKLLRSNPTHEEAKRYLGNIAVLKGMLKG